MIRGKFNTVVDGQMGSCGKGLIASYLAWKHRPGLLSTTNMANAGHTAVHQDGRRFVAKALPSPAILRRWCPDYHPLVVVGPSAAFHLPQLLQEVEQCGLQDRSTAADHLPAPLLIHPRAGVITDQHRQAEGDLATGTKHLASTMQGCGSFLADKIMRRRELRLAGDYPELQPYCQGGEQPQPLWLQRQLRDGQTILHEGSQGFSLDIHHGLEFPYCTSRQTTATQNLADMGLPYHAMGDIYLVIRPYPIRVGNVVEQGQQVGYSGGGYSDQHELQWAEVAAAAGMPAAEAAGLLQTELTTVTKRLRRVFSFSPTQLRQAVAINGATKLAVNFANYVDWDCRNTDRHDRLTPRVLEFMRQVEDIAQIPVALVGTGPAINHVIDLEP